MKLLVQTAVQIISAIIVFLVLNSFCEDKFIVGLFTGTISMGFAFMAKEAVEKYQKGDFNP